MPDSTYRPKSKKFQDLTGQIFGHLTAIRPVSVLPTKWECRCTCGSIVVTQAGNLKNENAPRSCKQCAYERETKHGFARRVNGGQHPLYLRWKAMRGRCNNPKNARYPYYGGRGIRVCERWSDFENFSADMGTTFSPELSLERKDNSGPYSPDNCMWADRVTQMNNTRGNRTVRVGSESATVAQWSRKVHIPAGKIISRLNRGWKPETALQ